MYFIAIVLKGSTLPSQRLESPFVKFRPGCWQTMGEPWLFNVHHWINSVNLCQHLKTMMPNYRINKGLVYCDINLQHGRNLHCNGEDVTGCSDGHAGGKDHLLTTTVQNTLVWIPGCGQSEGDMHLFVSFPPYNHNHTQKHARRCNRKLHMGRKYPALRFQLHCVWLKNMIHEPMLPQHI